MVQSGKRAVDLSIDAHEFHRVLAMAQKFDRSYYLNLRRDLRAAADISAVDVRKEVLKPSMVQKKRPLRKPNKVENAATGTLEAVAKPSKKADEQAVAQHEKYMHHLRARIAKGVKVQIGTREKSKRVGVFIVSRGSDPASKALKRSWDREKGWRHPVWQKGNKKDKWVTQHGRPYFGGVIQKHVPQIEAAVKKALDQTVSDIAAWDRLVAKHNATK